MASGRFLVRMLGVGDVMRCKVYGLLEVAELAATQAFSEKVFFFFINVLADFLQEFQSVMEAGFTIEFYNVSFSMVNEILAIF